LVEMDFTRASLYEALDRAGHPAARADYELEARCAEAPAAKLLGLAVGAPVLFATTVAFGEDGRVLDLGQTVYRADRYRFQATLTRRVQRERGSTDEETLATAGRTGGRRRGVRRHARDQG
jgi:GntR family transcriptional regulator